MRVAEGDALLREVVRDVRGEREVGDSGAPHAFAVERHRGQHAGRHAEADEERVDRVEQRLLVLLVVLVVGERLSLEHGQRLHEVADDPRALSARQFGNVRVLLLRHDAGPRRVTVVEAQEAELGGRPEDDLLGKPRQVHHRERRGGVDIHDEVAVRDGVQRVLGHAVEAEGARDGGAVDEVGDACECARSERQDVGAGAGLGESLSVARQHRFVGLEVMGEEDGLRPLKVGVAGHRCSRLALREVEERRAECAQGLDDRVARGSCMQSRVRRDLVVPRSGGVQAPAGVAHPLGEGGLDVEVDVLAVEPEREGAGIDLGPDRLEASDHHIAVVGGDDALRCQHPGMRDRALDVLAVEAAVEVD